VLLIVEYEHLAYDFVLFEWVKCVCVEILNIKILNFQACHLTRIERVTPLFDPFTRSPASFQLSSG
jgi:hypothetical protein